MIFAVYFDSKHCKLKHKRNADRQMSRTNLYPWWKQRAFLMCQNITNLIFIPRLLHYSCFLPSENGIMFHSRVFCESRNMYSFSLILAFYESMFDCLKTTLIVFWWKPQHSKLKSTIEVRPLNRKCAKKKSFSAVNYNAASYVLYIASLLCRT